MSAKPVMTRTMKLTEQDQMLPALVGGHARHHGVLHVSPCDRFAAPDDRVVQEHAADDGKDEHDVNEADPADNNRAEVVGVNAVFEVNAGEDELLRDALVALAAGGLRGWRG